MKKKGSLTIYSALSMLLIATALLTLFEGARYQELARLSQLQTQLALESVFANYNTLLWQEYRLLGCGQEDMEEILIQTANAKTKQEDSGLNLLLLEMDSVEITGYTLMTDGGGSAYVQGVSTYMEENILYEVATRLYSQYESMYSIKESSELDMSNIDTALEELQNVQEQETTDTSTGTAGQSSASDTEEDSKESASEEATVNPLEDVKSVQNTGVLELVIEDTSSISVGEADLSNVVSARDLKQGVNSQIPESDWYDKVLFQQYLLGYLSCYTNPMEEHSLSYELEYLIGGKSSDVENLKAVVTQLLLIRTLANFLYISTDAVKVEEATVLATTLAGASLNPTLIQVVKIGLLTAWAFGESVLDVRALLCGKRIPLLKSAETWTLELENIGAISEGYMMAEESQWGLTYMDYLGILLLFQEENTLALRTMDLQEATIRKVYGLPDFCMDELMVQAEVKMKYNQTFSTTASFGYY